MCLRDIQRYDAVHDPITVNFWAIGSKFRTQTCFLCTHCIPVGIGVRYMQWEAKNKKQPANFRVFLNNYANDYAVRTVLQWEILNFRTILVLLYTFRTPLSMSNASKLVENSGLDWTTLDWRVTTSIQNHERYFVFFLYSCQSLPRCYLSLLFKM